MIPAPTARWTPGSLAADSHRMVLQGYKRCTHMHLSRTHCDGHTCCFGVCFRVYISLVRSIYYTLDTAASSPARIGSLQPQGAGTSFGSAVSEATSFA